VCVVGSHDLFEHPHINDLAYMPAIKDGRFGFNLLVGGFFSPRRCAEAVPLDAWVSADDVIPVCKAILMLIGILAPEGTDRKQE
jgi:ferredoxin-nitrite reductase